MLKVYFLGYILIADSMSLLGFESCRFVWNWAVQGHSMLPSLVPIESSYATSY